MNNISLITQLGMKESKFSKSSILINNNVISKEQVESYALLNIDQCNTDSEASFMDFNKSHLKKQNQNKLSLNRI